MSHLAIVREGSTDAELVAPADGERPESLLSVGGTLLVGIREADGRGSIRKLVAGPQGVSLVEWLGADALAASSAGSMIPRRMAYDPVHEKLLVGGEINPATASDPSNHAGRGLARISVSPDLATIGQAEGVFNKRDRYSELMPWQVELIHADAAGRWWVSGYQLCNATKLRRVGLLRIDQDESGEARLVRPYVSGVREIAVDPVEGNTWLGLRDENPGMSCDGINVQQTLCRLKDDGSCEIYTPVINSSEDIGISAGIGAMGIAFGNPVRHEFALATIRDATYVRVADSSTVVATQIAPGLNLRMTSAAWGESGELWLGSFMQWDAYPGMDEEAINARGPHGLGLIELSDQALVDADRRYVRAAPPDSATAENIEGVPSNQAWDVLPLAGRRHAVAAFGIERDSMTYDHILGPPNSRNLNGGIALIEDAQVHVFVPPTGVTFGDVMKLARRSDGTVFALDAQAGVVTLDLEGLTSELYLPAAWPQGVRAISLAVDDEGRVAVGTEAGLVYVWDAEKHLLTVGEGAAYGFVWELRFMEPGALYAGTDQGLVRVALDEARLPARGPGGLLPRELWELPAHCSGDVGCACLSSVDCNIPLDCSFDEATGLGTCLDLCGGGEGCLCDAPSQCAPPLDCVIDPGTGAGSCLMPDPCAANPNGLGCTCDETAPACDTGLACSCNYLGCTCQRDPSLCDGVSSCPCVDGSECPIGNWYCSSTTSQCTAKQACDADCSCSTANGCSSTALYCQPGFAGRSCIPVQ